MREMPDSIHPASRPDGAALSRFFLVPENEYDETKIGDT